MPLNNIKTEHEKQVEDIEGRIAHPARPPAIKCDDEVASELHEGGSLMPVYADKLGRLWVWWPETEQLQMVFDPREARG